MNPTSGKREKKSWVSESEDHAKLGGVGLNGGEDLPAAGLEVFGDGAIAGERDLVVGGGDRAELKNRDGGVRGTGNLHGVVHPWGLGEGFHCICVVRLWNRGQK